MKLQIIPLGLVILMSALFLDLGVFLGSSQQDEMAPSYKEIKQTMDRITGHDIDPNLPEVGADGVVDREISKKWRSYQETLGGKTVKGWQGWYEGYTEIDPGKGYNVAILMEEQQPGARPYSEVLIRNVAPDQLSKLQSWEYGQPVIFSGKVEGLWWTGSLELKYSTIEAAADTETSR